MQHTGSQACFVLGLLTLSGCVSNPLPAPPPTLPCPATVQIDNNKVQATTQALQKRLQEKEQIIVERNQQIEVLSSQLDALKRIDQDTHPKKLIVPPQCPLSLKHSLGVLQYIKIPFSLVSRAVNHPALSRGMRGSNAANAFSGIGRPKR